MARQERQTREKQQVDSHQKQLRRNQVIFAVLSFFLILSMLISLIRY